MGKKGREKWAKEGKERNEAKKDRKEMRMKE